MAAHVRLHSTSSPSTWTELELAASYATLRPPVVDFEAWCQTFGLKVESPEAAANENAINLIMSDQGTPSAPPVTVEKA